MNKSKKSIIACCALLVALVFTAGCTYWPLLYADWRPPHPDPLQGWRECMTSQVDETITEDYRSYIQKLSPQEQQAVSDSCIHFFRDETGHHAVRIEIPLDNRWRHHVLIYDKANKRTRVIKYHAGGYRS
jgi:hypothetical protein